MKKYFLLSIIPLMFACKKMKERKFTGTFQGTASWYKEENEFDEELGEYLPNVIRTEGNEEVTVEVVRNGDFIFISNYPEHKISVDQIRVGQSSLSYLYKGGGGKSFQYELTENSLSYKRYIYEWSASFEYNYSKSFSGVKIN